MCKLKHLPLSICYQMFKTKKPIITGVPCVSKCRASSLPLFASSAPEETCIMLQDTCTCLSISFNGIKIPHKVVANTLIFQLHQSIECYSENFYLYLPCLLVTLVCIMFTYEQFLNIFVSWYFFVGVLLQF